MSDADVGALTIQDAYQLFGPPVVRVLLDWHALFEARATTSLRVLHSPEEIHRLFTTWYVATHENREISFRDAVSRPLRIGALSGSLTMLEPGRASKMAEIAAAQGSGTGTWVVPCYRLTNDDLLLLDGNHRLGAMAVHGVVARVLVVVIHGPLDPKILPDLAAWTPQT